MSKFIISFMPVVLLCSCKGGSGIQLLDGQSSSRPFVLEVNVGPLPVDIYDQVNNTFIKSCDTNKTVRACFQEAFANYAKQKVTGIRFMFDMTQANFPFHADNSLDNHWLQQMAIALSDIKAAGINNITPTPNWNGWGNESQITVNDPCTNQNVSLKFYRTAPYGFDIQTGFPFNRPDGSEYSCGPANPIFVGWGNIYTLFDKVLELAQGAQLNVNEFDIQNEINVDWFPIEARVIVDNKHSNTGDGNVYANVRALMAKHGFDPGNATYSVPGANSDDANFDCADPYGNSGRITNLSALLEAIRGRSFGRGSGWSVQHKLICGGTAANQTILALAQPVPRIFDVHSYNCVMGADGHCDPTKNDQISADAKTLFNGISRVIQKYGSLTTTEYMMGETHTMIYKDAVTTCEDDQIPRDTLEQTAQSMLVSPLGSSPGRASTLNVLRPWNYIMDASGCATIYQQIPL